MLVGITAVMGVVLRRSARCAHARMRGAPTTRGGETAMLSVALQEALTRLKEQERATAARAEASERLSSQIIAGLAAGLVVVDRDGVVQIVNPAARRILSLGRRRRGRSIADLLVARRAPGAGDRRAAQQPACRSCAARCASTVRPSHLGVTVSPLVGGDGELQAAVCLFTDLTEVVELEEQLRLKEALARLGELTAGLAHEFRNGLATIHGYARLLDPRSCPTAYRHLRRRHSRRDRRRSARW